MLKILIKRVYQTVMLTALLSCLIACANFLPSQKVEPSPASPQPKPATEVLLPSSEPLLDVSKKHIVYAQNALNKLGFKLGLADGVWGPRSASAIRKFEQANNLDSASGHLSELNLSTLEKITLLTRGSEAPPITQKEYSLSARVEAKVPSQGAPQLVIIETTRALLAKPNPYSEVITTLASGTGIYLLGLQEGWYEVESEDQIRGYLKAN